jgi:hypothetical protein
MVVASRTHRNATEAIMADDLKKKGKRDGARMSDQPHEVKYLARKHGKSSAEVREAKAGAKGSRKSVERQLKK